ncbi:MAG: DUF6631 family protein [Lysobacter sp.]
MTDDLQVLEPSGSSVTYLGTALEIKPLTVGQLPRMVRVARPVIDSVLALESLPDEDTGALVDFVLDMVDRHGEAMFEAAAIATGRDREWIERGDIGEFIDLAKVVFEVNRDFFVRKLGPLLADRAKGRSGAGLTSSSSSSSAATH